MFSFLYDDCSRCYVRNLFPDYFAKVTKFLRENFEISRIQVQILLSYPKLVQNVHSTTILIKSWKDNPLTFGRRPNNKR